MNDSSVLRLDGHQFPREYLQSANRDVAEEYLWPLPVFERMRETSRVVIGDIEIKPGDVLEYCGDRYEEYLLVITVLPEPASTSSPPLTESNKLLLYSSNVETYRVFNADNFWSLQNTEKRVANANAEYVVHSDAATLVESTPVTDDSPPDVTFPPRPRVGKNDGASDRIEKQYPHTDATSCIHPDAAFKHDTDPISELLHSVNQGDAQRVLKRFPTGSIHGWVTSPPYFHQRDYDTDGQLGVEDSIDAYLESLLSVVNQLMRVTHETGIGWIILDDSYHDGKLAGIPERLHEELRAEGYSIVHHSPWIKSNPKPEPVDNRLSHAHEYVLAITHSDTDHYFNKHALDEKTDVFSAAVGNTETDHDAVFPVALPKRLIKASIPEQVCSECGEPFRQTYSVTDIRDLPDDRPQAARAVELAEKHGLTDEQLRAVRSVGLGDTGQSERTQNGSGKNTDAVEALASEASDVLGSYAREFTQAKKKPTGFEQACDCDSPATEPGIVVDPFAGSGTTCVAAKELHRRWAGIELNEDYVAVAESRIGIDVSDPDRLTKDEQETLTEFV